MSNTLPTIRLTNPLPSTLLSDDAKAWAQACTPASKKDKNLNATTQIRRFYDELCYWDEKVRSAKGDAAEVAYRDAEPYIQMMKAKAHYAMGRKLIDQTCLDFIVGIINGIRDVKTIQNGKLLFEAFMGYKKYFEERSKQ